MGDSTRQDYLLTTPSGETYVLSASSLESAERAAQLINLDGKVTAITEETDES